jgi:protein SCO1/2
MDETPPGAPAPRGVPAWLLALGIAAVALAVALYLSGLPARWFGTPPALVFHGRDITGEHWDGAFTLTDAEGKPRSLGDFRGKIVLLSFGYTHCPDVCPTTLAKFAEARRLLGADGARVQALFVTIDPERDTAELLRAYVPAFDPSFIGLRGSEAQTDAVTRAYHANYQVVQYQGSILVDHTASTYIVDAQGHPRVITPYDQTARALADDVLTLLRSG